MSGALTCTGGHGLGWLIVLEYDGTREDFIANLEAIIPALRLGEHKRAMLWECAQAILDTASDWRPVRACGVDRLFLAWLISPSEDWLFAVPQLGDSLPNTVLGSSSTGQYELKNRDRRVAHCVEALRDWGWAEDQAICFVASREEWRAAKMEAGRT